MLKWIKSIWSTFFSLRKNKSKVLPTKKKEYEHFCPMCGQAFENFADIDNCECNRCGMQLNSKK